MNPTTPEPEGSIRMSDVDANSGTTGSLTEQGSTHWAYGMPLSYVLEMAYQQLGAFDQIGALAAPAASENIQGSND